jgi:predicted aspartyl protease
MRFNYLIVSMVLLVSIPSGAMLAENLTDPYEILHRYVNAMGGLDRILAEKTSYSEGTASLGSMEGTFKIWTRRPGLNRNEISVGPLSMIQGDNGEHQWVVDQNGKVQVITNVDEVTKSRRKIQNLTDDFAFADRNSDIFHVELTGIEPVNGRDCYAIKITNNLNPDVYTAFIDTVTFLQDKAIFIRGDNQSRDSYYSDYRNVDGLMVPFSVTEISRDTGEKQGILISKYTSNPEVEPARFEPPEQGTKDYRFTEGDRSEDIPCKFTADHLFVDVTVDGKKRTWVLDTGAGMSCLNKAYAEELGLELEGGLKGQGAGGAVNVSFAKLPSFELQGIRFDGQTFAVVDFSELIRRLGVDIGGVLGFDFLSRFVTKVDYANDLVSFYDPETFVYSGEGHVVDMRLNRSVFSTNATLDGTHAGSWLIDLGAGTTSLDGRYALREGYAGKRGAVTVAHGASNEFKVKTVRCDSIRFAGFTVHNPVISLSYGGTDTTFAEDRIGTLGNSLFRNFVFYCDYTDERIIVEKGVEFDKPVPINNSGLSLATDGKGLIEVMFVSPDSPAERSGFLKGDMLKSIDGKGIAEYDGLIPIRELFKAKPGTEYDIVIDRNGEAKRMKMTLADML